MLAKPFPRWRGIAECHQLNRYDRASESEAKLVSFLLTADTTDANRSGFRALIQWLQAP